MTQEEIIIAAFFILECEPGCSEEDVKSSYRQLVRVWHPDRFDTDQKLKQKATEKMKLLNEAYQLLLRCFEAQRNQSESTQQETPSLMALAYLVNSTISNPAFLHTATTASSSKP